METKKLNIKTVTIKTSHMRITVDCQDMINFGYSGIAIITKELNITIPLNKIISANLENNWLTLELISI